MAYAMVFLGTVAEIQTEDVCAGLEQRFDLFARGAGGAQGRNDLGSAITAHRPVALSCSAVDEDSAKIVYVRPGGTGADQAAGRRKHRPRIVVAKPLLRVKPLGPNPFQSFRAQQCSGGILRPVYSIGIVSQGVTLFRSVQGDGE